MSPAERKRLGYLLGLLAVAAAVSFWPRGGSDAARPRTTTADRRLLGGRGKAAQDGSFDLPPFDPNPGVREDIDGKVKRNIFGFYVKPTPVPTPPPPPPTPIPLPGSPLFVGPMPRPTPPPPTPIIPPNIPYKAIGIFGPKDDPIVSFEDGPRLISARQTDVLDGKFILKKVNRESVDFAFVGLPPEITRRIPVLPPDRTR